MGFCLQSDKNSIIQTAAETIEELRREMETLKRRKLELEMALLIEADRANDDKETMQEAKIRLRVAHPSSGIDSMLEVLKCLKNTGTKAKALQSNFTSQEFSAILHIEAKVSFELLISLSPPSINTSIFCTLFFNSHCSIR